MLCASLHTYGAYKQAGAESTSLFPAPYAERREKEESSEMLAITMPRLRLLVAFIGVSALAALLALAAFSSEAQETIRGATITGRARATPSR